MAASAWWAVREKRLVAEEARQTQIKAVADHIEQSAMTLLASNDVSALRRAVAGAKRDNQLASARVSLMDGRVLADGEPTKISPGEVPERFPSGPLDGPSAVKEEAGSVVVRRPMIVPGRGAAMLELTYPAAVSGGSSWSLAAGLGLMCVTGLAALWLVYRHTRAKVRTLALIRDGLLAMRGGEKAREVLEIAGECGPEVAAWNELLKEAEALRKGMLLSQIGQLPERRKESKSELELACDSLSVGMIVLDGQGKAKHGNGAAASLLGMPREKLTGTDVAAVIDHADIRSAIMGIVTGVSMQRRTAEVTRAHPAPQGPDGAAAAGGGPASVLRVQVRPLRREDSCSALVTIEDVTQLRVAEAARHAFVAQATHELRTPLTNMRLCLEMAIEEGAKDAAVLGKSLNTLNQETRRLERMVSEMLSVAEIEAGSLELHAGDVRLETVFESLRGDFEVPAGEKKIELKFDLPPKIPVIHGDRDKLVLAIHNLIGNAIKYTPPGGKVTVKLAADAKDVTLEVTDTGIGISEQDQPLVFEKFYRAKDPRVEKVTGSGLGLALALEVARLHGGGITLRSQLDQGSTFTLTVPVHAQSNRRAA
jgi:PAS domain S-box-containing protein